MPTDKSKAARSKASGNWMAGAFNPKHKGMLHRALGIPKDETIPVAMLRAKAKGNSALAARARAALTAGKISRKNAKR